MTEVDLMFKYY